MDLNLKNKKALVVASSQGLGKAIAAQLAKEGTKIMITSRDEAKLKSVQKEFREQFNGDVEYYPADVTNPDDIKSLIKHTAETLGGIDILINNAGGPPGGRLKL